jgi:uncharacterized protein (DUF1697 family)
VTESVALLRGINLGAHHRVTMADLRAVFTAAGCEQLTTYIQSGNVVFTHPTSSPAQLERDLSAAVEASTGFPVPVVVRTGHEMAAVVRDNPFPEADTAILHVAFLGTEPPADALDGLDLDAYAPERLAVVGRELYLHLPNGMGRAKLPQALRALKAGQATVRNWRTVTKLVELAAAVE